MKVFLKKIILLCTILASKTFFAQNNLAVKFQRTYSDHGADLLISEITILRDNQLFKKIEGPNAFVLYESVPDGKYSFEYANIFGETIKKEFSIPNSKKSLNQSEVLLYADKLQDSIPKDLFIQKIKNDEKIVVKFRFSGCYSGRKDSLTIFKSNNDLYVLHKRKKRKLKTDEIEFLMQYENELKHLKEVSFASTANGINEVIYNSERLYYVEPSVYWGGFDLLKKKLKLK